MWAYLDRIMRSHTQLQYTSIRATKSAGQHHTENRRYCLASEPFFLMTDTFISTAVHRSQDAGFEFVPSQHIIVLSTSRDGWVPRNLSCVLCHIFNIHCHITIDSSTKVKTRRSAVSAASSPFHPNTKAKRNQIQNETVHPHNTQTGVS